MQIIVNTRLLIKNKLEGIGWFTYQTLKNITQKNKNVHFIFLFDRDFEQEFIFSDNVTPLIISPQARHPFLYYAWFQFSVKNILNKIQPDLFLSPDGFLSMGAKCKQLPVIHDINFFHNPKDLKWLTAKFYNYYFPKYANIASRIATVSEFSKQDIVTNYKINSDKVDVVYNGINGFFRELNSDLKEQTKQKFTSGNDYFISISSLHPRKNIPNLIKAFALFKQESQSNYKLMIVGPNFWGISEINNAIEESKIKESIVFTGRLSNEDLSLALGSAKALTFVPFYEGFGIPLIEAMASQIPIITSNVSSLPEIAGDAAILVNPREIFEIKNAMLKIHNSNLVCSDLIKKGNFQKQKFSWEKTSDLLWQTILKTI